MTITDSIRARIVSALRAKNMNHSELAERMGLSNAWVTKLMKGTLKTLTEDNVEKLEAVLGIQFFRLVQSSEKVSGLGIEVSKATRDNPELVKAIESVLALDSRNVFTPPYHTTKQLMGLGEDVIRLAHAEQDRPGKVGRTILEWLSQDPAKKRKMPRQYKTSEMPSQKVAEDNEEE